jgi:hypothetical protein
MAVGSDVMDARGLDQRSLTDLMVAPTGTCRFSVSVKPRRISGFLNGEDVDTTMLPSTAFRGSQARQKA